MRDRILAPTTSLGGNLFALSSMILISTIFIELSGVLLFIRTRLFCIGLIGIIVIIFKVFTDHRCSGIYI